MYKNNTGPVDVEALTGHAWAEMQGWVERKGELPGSEATDILLILLAGLGYPVNDLPWQS